MRKYLDSANLCHLSLCNGAEKLSKEKKDAPSLEKWAAGEIHALPGWKEASVSRAETRVTRGAGGQRVPSRRYFSPRCLAEEDKSTIKISFIFPLICSFPVLARLIRHMLPISCSS